MELGNKKKFGYGVPAYTGPFLALVLRKYDVRGVVWINLAQDVVQWRAIVNTAMNLLP
jgi:hypothetical protein